MRGAQLILAPADYVRATSATLGPISGPVILSREDGEGSQAS
jgi:hypothetical protein